MTPRGSQRRRSAREAHEERGREQAGPRETDEAVKRLMAWLCMNSWSSFYEQTEKAEAGHGAHEAHRRPAPKQGKDSTQ